MNREICLPLSGTKGMHSYTQLEATFSIDSQMLSPGSIGSGLGKGTGGALLREDILAVMGTPGYKTH